MHRVSPKQRVRRVTAACLTAAAVGALAWWYPPIVVPLTVAFGAYALMKR